MEWTVRFKLNENILKIVLKNSYNAKVFLKALKWSWQKFRYPQFYFSKF